MAYNLALAALADPTRRTVLERLSRAPASVRELADGLPVSRPAVSQHLRVLRGAGLVRERRDGTRRIYSVEPRGLVELRRYLDGLWNDALDAFAAAAHEPPAPPARRPGKKSRRPSGGKSHGKR
jgi:DNA-binding transcriptional ArsR family regulator